VLLCKLDRNAEHYKDVSLSYIFLTNNLQHVVSKVRTSNLQYLLGEEWITRHEAKARQFATNYERLAWGKVVASLPQNPSAVISPAEAKEIFRKFNLSFEEACRKQSAVIVSDPKLRDEIKVSIARKVVTVYREFFEKHRLTVGGERNVGLYVRFAPEDVGNHLSDLFFGTKDSVSSPSSSSSSTHRRRLQFRA
jgi:exocyst complex protein 7